MTLKIYNHKSHACGTSISHGLPKASTFEVNQCHC